MKAVEHLKEITRERINLASTKEDVERVAVDCTHLAFVLGYNFAYEELAKAQQPKQPTQPTLREALEQEIKKQLEQ